MFGDVVGVETMHGKKWNNGRAWAELGAVSGTTFSGSGLTNFSAFTAFRSGILAVTFANFYAQQVADHVRLPGDGQRGYMGFNLYRGTTPGRAGLAVERPADPVAVADPGGFTYTWDDYAGPGSGDDLLLLGRGRGYQRRGDAPRAGQCSLHRSHRRDAGQPPGQPGWRVLGPAGRDAAGAAVRPGRRRLGRAAARRSNKRADCKPAPASPSRPPAPAPWHATSLPVQGQGDPRKQIHKEDRHEEQMDDRSVEPRSGGGAVWRVAGAEGVGGHV